MTRIRLEYRPIVRGWWIAPAAIVAAAIWAALLWIDWQTALIVLGASQAAALAVVVMMEARHG